MGELLVHAIGADRPERVLDYMKIKTGAFPIIPSAVLSFLPTKQLTGQPPGTTFHFPKPDMHFRAAGPLYVLSSLLPTPFLLLCQNLIHPTHRMSPFEHKVSLSPLLSPTSRELIAPSSRFYRTGSYRLHHSSYYL